MNEIEPEAVAGLLEAIAHFDAFDPPEGHFDEFAGIGGDDGGTKGKGKK